MSGDGLLKKILQNHGARISELLNSVANEHRVQVASMLVDGPADFSKLQEATGLSKTALSHHLGILSGSGVITNPSRGRYELSVDGRALLSAIGDTYMGTV
jgi:DNA-binding transcriptional ArsR family regulator